MTPERRIARVGAVLVCFLLGWPVGAALMFLLEHRASAQPAWLALAAGSALAAAAGCDWLLRCRAAGGRTSTHRTHGGRPGQGRTSPTSAPVPPAEK
ncbi:hypothetical protein [Kitasatospora cineracea]|uniref:hypothetical protein n=1 Tax=Kitasatospora cineracea TaxID=88074 RepID=UPI0011CE6F21|nr:hypothetical protein [Kitasatospora cineracea]